MTIEIIKQPPVRVTESDLLRYSDEYQRAYMHYAGTPPTLEEYIRRQRGEVEQDVATLMRGG